MGCCGQRRENLRSSSGVPMAPPASPPIAHSSERSAPAGRQAPGPVWRGYASVRLRYTESSPVLVLGPATGWQYRFSGDSPIQLVDVRDADAFVRSRFFVRIA